MPFKTNHLSEKTILCYVILLAALLLLTAMVSAAELNPDQHLHQQIEIPEQVKPPKLAVTVVRDARSGYNLHLQSENYFLQPPEQAGSNSNEFINGHAHLFVNGQKIRRLYGPDTHIEGELLQPGLNNIAVTLNTHEHHTWTVNGRPLTASVTLDASKKNDVLHVFSSSPFDE